jgi:F-type H+-transporting ATPase subunit b
MKVFAVNARACLFCAVTFLLTGASVHIAAAQEEKAKSAEHAEATSAKADAHGAATHAEPGPSHDAESHAAGHHDETDLSHGNASPNLDALVDPRFDMSIYSFLVFLILLGVLYKFAWGPIATALQGREETIARQIEDARMASEKAALQLREYEARLAAATEEARQIVAGARKDAEVAKDRIVAEARNAAQKERERAVADINIAKNQALDQIAKKSVQTAVSLAGQLIRREVKPQEHEALIGEAINEFSNVN